MQLNDSKSILTAKILVAKSIPRSAFGTRLADLIRELLDYITTVNVNGRNSTKLYEIFMTCTCSYKFSQNVYRRLYIPTNHTISDMEEQLRSP